VLTITKEPSGQSWFSGLVGHAAVALAAGGLLLYSFTFVALSAFYSPLGVGLEEVGLNYASVTGKFSWVPLSSLNDRRNPYNAWSRLGRKGVAVALSIGVVICLGVVLPYFMYNAAQRVMNGATFSRNLLLAPIHAEAATVASVEKGGVNPTIEALARLELTYLGQSDGILVLYDPKMDQAIRVSASLVVLYTAQ
jgi:hypothetical protein